MADELSKEALDRLKESVGQRQQSISLITKENEQLEEGLKKKYSLLEL